eukprot:Em0005g494a
MDSFCAIPPLFPRYRALISNIVRDVHILCDHSHCRCDNYRIIRAVTSLCIKWPALFRPAVSKHCSTVDL